MAEDPQPEFTSRERPTLATVGSGPLCLLDTSVSEAWDQERGLQRGSEYRILFLLGASVLHMHILQGPF